MKTEYSLKSGNTLRIFEDENAQSPDTWDNKDMFLVIETRQFEVKRKGFDIDAINDHSDHYFIFPINAYIHSGIKLYFSENETRYRGYILIDKNDMDFDANRAFKAEWKDKSDNELAQIFAEGLLETWNQYLSNEVYGFEIIQKKTFKKIYEDGTTSNDSEIEEITIDSCSGFYGDNIHTNGILDHINDEITL